MPRFFVPTDAIHAGRALIGGADAVHIARSLRARRGERFVIVDDSGSEHGLLLDTVTNDRVEGVVEWSRPATGEPSLRVLVVQALPQNGMDAAVEAMAEVGVAELWPVISERTVRHPDPRRAAGRVERWRAIAREAAGLAGRGAVPVVREVVPLRDALTALPPETRVVALSVDARSPLAGLQVEPARPLALVIGPEGGLGPRDLADLAARGAEQAHLGPRVLRSRLAGAVALGIVLARAGELSNPGAPPALGAAHEH